MSLVPLGASFSHWAGYWQAGVNVRILSGDALFTAAHMSLRGPPLQGTLRLPQVKNSLILIPPFIRGAKEVENVSVDSKEQGEASSWEMEALCGGVPASQPAVEDGLVPRSL